MDARKSAFEALTKLLGAARVNTALHERIHYSHDVAPAVPGAGMLFQTVPDFVVLPKSAAEVSEVFRIGAAHSLPVVARGAGTGSLGGTVPTQGGILIHTALLDQIVRIDPASLTVTVQPGVTWSDLERRLAPLGGRVPCYPTSGLASTIGGWLASGGVGVGSVRHGSAVDHLVSVEAILPDGTVARFGAEAARGRSGAVDLGALLVGSEGTLGIITEATLRYAAAGEELRPLLYTFPKYAALFPALEALARSSLAPYHVSFFDGNHFRFLRILGRPAPKAGAALLVVLEGRKAVVDSEEKALEALLAAQKAVRAGAEEGAAFWEDRWYDLRAKRIGTGAGIARVLVPVHDLAALAQETSRIAQKLKLSTAQQGMLVDRSTAYFSPYFLSDERRRRRVAASGVFVVHVAKSSLRHHGHPLGLGLTMANLLPAMRRPSAIAMLRVIKEALDPQGISNPGKTLEMRTRFGFPLGRRAFAFGVATAAARRRLSARDHLGEKEAVALLGAHRRKSVRRRNRG